MRLFTAIRPDRPALAHLDAALTSVGLAPREGGGPPALRLVPPENRHVTLAFHGEVPDGALDDLVGALADLLPPALESAWEEAATAESAGAGSPAGEPVAALPTAALSGAGVFAGRTLWVGVHDGGLLAALAGASVQAAQAVGVPVDADRPRFRAHLTVARVSARAAQGDRRGDRRHRDLTRRDGRGRAGGPGRRGARRPAGVDISHFAADLAAPLDPAHAAAHALAVYRGPSFPVTEALVVASEPGRGDGGGPLHETVGRVALLD